VIRPHPIGYGMTADLPQVTLESAYVERVWASDILLTEQGSPTLNMAALIAAIEAAAVRVGHSRIRIPAGMQLHGKCMMVPHTGGDYWTYIEAEDLPTAEGVRTSPSDHASANTPTLTAVFAGTDTTALGCRRAANNYRVTGLHFQAEPSAIGLVYYTVAINAWEDGLDYDQSQTLVEHCPTDIILDRIYISGPVGDTGLVSAVSPGAPDGDTPQGRNRQNLSLNGIRTALVDSYLTGAFNGYDESKGILITNTPGPLKIVNNFCDSGSIPLLAGGSMPALGASIGRSRDVECRRNQFEHPLAWMPPVDANPSRKWGLKGAFEIKNGERWLVEGNVFSRTPSGAQEGVCVVLKSAGSGGSNSAGLGTANVTFRHNVVRNCRNAIGVAGYGDPLEIGVEQCHDISIYHTLAYDVGLVELASGGYGTHDGSGTIVTLINPALNVVMRFNTFVNNGVGLGALIKVDAVNLGEEATGLVFSDNLIVSESNCTSVVYSGLSNAIDSLNRYASEWTWERNYIAGLDLQSYCSLTLPQGNGNLYPNAGTNPTIEAVIASAGFVDPASRNYRLAESSPAKGIGFGGADPGCDMSLVELSTAGVAS
jgi:hypothetical protein